MIGALVATDAKQRAREGREGKGAEGSGAAQREGWEVWVARLRGLLEGAGQRVRGVLARPPPSTYVQVQAGDSLWSLSEAFLGGGMQWRRIAEYNGIANPRGVPRGAFLELPPPPSNVARLW